MQAVGLLAIFASLSGLVAAWCWVKVATSVDSSGQVVKGPNKRALANAATATAFALGFGAIAALMGVYVSGV